MTGTHSLGPIPLNKLPAHMPEILTWDHEPQVRNGDEFVFSWRKFHEEINGTIHSIEVPHVYIRLTSNPKRRRTLNGYEWRASYCWCNMEDYMAPGAGTTTEQARSIDPERPVAPVEPKSIEVKRAEAAARALKRRRPGKRERRAA